MNEIPPKRVGEFLRIVFFQLWHEKNGLPVKDVLAHIPQETQLLEGETEFLPSTHSPRYERVIRLATTPYVKAGWLLKSRDRWILTEEGKQACKGFPTAEAFYQEAGRIFKEWQEARSRRGIATEEAEEMAWEQIRNYLQEMKPYEFQMLVEDLLKAIGYHMTWVAPPEKERGYVNLVVHSDPLGLGNPRIKVHILHGGQPVLLEGLKAFMGVLGSEDAGIFISTGGFTGSVIKEVQAQGSNKITLMDLDHFVDLWVEYYDRLTEVGRQRFPLKPIHFLAPME